MNLARGAARGAVWNFATVLFERGFAMLALYTLPALNLTGHLAVSLSVSALAFAAILIISAPKRIMAMANRLHRALTGVTAVKEGFS